MQLNGGALYNDRFPDGTPRLLFVQPAPGSNWTAAIELPRVSVLELAVQLSAPLLGLLFVVLIVASVGILVLTRAITKPIQETLGRGGEHHARAARSTDRHRTRRRSGAAGPIV